MRRFRDHPIRQKVLLILLVTTAGALLLAGTSLVLLDQFLFRTDVEEELASLADIIAYNSTAALAFNDPEAAATTLASLRARSHIVSACLYEPEGAILARYIRPGADSDCPPPPLSALSATTAASEVGEDLVITRRVMLANRPVGTLVIRHDLEELGARFRLFGLIVLTVLLVSTVAALLLSSTLRHGITDPVLSLAGTARSISRQQDFSVRAEKLSRDELGVLVDSFNEMLAGIQLRDDELRKARDELERRVLERTDELRRSESRFRAVTETAHEAIISANRHGLIIYWNRGAEETFGYTAVEAVGQPLTFIMPERFRQPHLGGLQRYLDTREARVLGTTLEMAGLRKDGSEFPVDLSLASWSIDDEMFFTGILRDITERKHAEEAIRQSEERFRLVVERVEDYAIIMLDATGHVATWNSGAERIEGYKANEIIGQHFSRFYTPEEVESGKPLLALQKAEAQGRVELESWRVRKDGSRFWANVVITALRAPDGKLIGFSKITRDLTDRRRAEEALRERASLLDLAHDAIVVRDIRNKITLWNRGAEETYGWSREEVLGRHFHDLLRTRFPQPFEEIEAELLKNDRWEGELVHTSRWGRRLVVDSRWALQREANGTAIGVLEINNDVTDRKRAEEDLKRQTEELARSNADLQQFAYVASHDLQEPLRMVISYMQLLSEEYKGKLGSDADEFIHYAVDGATRMRQLITGLLAYSRAGAAGHQAVPISCDLVMDEVRSNLELAIRESGATVTNDPLPTVVADPAQMLQLLQNLTGNALTFRGTAPPRIHVSAGMQDSAWRFAVSDNGIGIAPEHYERIFGIFQRLHDRMQYKGTGIGLAICKKIVERRGGRIWVESHPGQGSTFFFTVPIDPPDSETANGTEKVA